MEEMMLDHMTFRVRDIARTRAFYSAALAPLGYALTFDQVFEGQAVLGFSHLDATEPEGQRADVWFMDGDSPYGQAPTTTSCHLCWRAQSRAQVDAFHAAALAAGGRDHGAPGLRPIYHPNYYGAFVIDPEGNNIEAVCHLPG
jgi:catechol 2,3-dioxygenase-like lactoylglutathione lyase family enzyme